MRTEYVVSLLKQLNISISDNILYNIRINLVNNRNNNHISFLVEKNSRKILSYGFNYFLKTNTFPFSLHSEINTILKYYKKPCNTKNKKILIILKITKTGLIGMSKPCKYCVHFIRNNYDNLNLSEIYYSDRDEYGSPKLEMLKKEDLNYMNYRPSSGYRYY